jgi:uncharacterized protein YeaC (DUF1315 family)
MKKLPTYEEVSEKLEYDPETGFFRWRVHTSSAQKKGWFSGTKQKSGYLTIGLNGGVHRTHRLAILLTTGEWPDGIVDHINRDRHDNRIQNLRVVSAVQNQHNREARGYLKDHDGKFRSRIQIDNVDTNLGRYPTKTEARIAFHTFKNLVGLDPNYRGPTLL